MLSLYEILKASKTGIAPDMWTALAGMNWGGKDSGTEVKELTGIPPLSFTANRTPLLDYLISGNMSQASGVSPTTPIQPQECGELETVGEKAGQYKIPISSANTTTPVYLGEVQTTRKIKKLVFDGTENWQGVDSAASKYLQNSITDYKVVREVTCMSTHYSGANNVLPGDAIPNNSACFNLDSGLQVLYLKGSEPITLADFKDYLAQQYAAGTPVTIWYVLATPETGVVNEPLRKIGNYADTLSMEQAGVQIPTNRGNTVIDVLTELKPSEMYIKYQE